ncbi:hypothetical protein MHK_002648 [Candidatus Magnetomorum sp. HK-1]|nr:hypothetical protein MHK_002648 [Candidatus Magnetomorum sp. HK-1]
MFFSYIDVFVCISDFFLVYMVDSQLKLKNKCYKIFDYREHFLTLLLKLIANTFVIAY